MRKSASHVQLGFFSEAFKALGDPSRLRLLRLLIEADTELCVCELVDSLEQPQYNVSKHLRALKSAGLIESRKEGRWVYCWRAASDQRFLTLLHEAVAAIPREQIERDRAELRKRLKLRQGGKCLVGSQKRDLSGTSAKHRSRRES